jgi:hypothetical protein
LFEEKRRRLISLLKKLERTLTALELVPLVNLEAKERKRRTTERIMRIEQKKNVQKKSIIN